MCHHLLFMSSETPEEVSGDISRIEKAMCLAKAIARPRGGED